MTPRASLAAAGKIVTGHKFVTGRERMIEDVADAIDAARRSAVEECRLAIGELVIAQALANGLPDKGLRDAQDALNAIHDRALAPKEG